MSNRYKIKTKNLTMIEKLLPKFINICSGDPCLSFIWITE